MWNFLMDLQSFLLLFSTEHKNMFNIRHLVTSLNDTKSNETFFWDLLRIFLTSPGLKKPSPSWIIWIFSIPSLPSSPPIVKVITHHPHHPLDTYFFPLNWFATESLWGNLIKTFPCTRYPYLCCLLTHWDWGIQEDMQVTLVSSLTQLFTIRN